MKILVNILKLLKVLLTIPFQLIWLFGVAWGNATPAQRRSWQSAFWWFLIIIVAPSLMMWNSCELRPVVRKRNALIEVNCKGAKSFSNQEVEEAYQYGLEQGWFDKHPQLKKY